jgi:hypothetical protein
MTVLFHLKVVKILTVQTVKLAGNIKKTIKPLPLSLKRRINEMILRDRWLCRLYLNGTLQSQLKTNEARYKRTSCGHTKKDEGL